MRWTDIPFHPGSATLRRFGGWGFLLLTGIAAWQAGHQQWTVAAGVLAVALVLGVLALAYPTALRPIFVGMMVVSFPLGWLAARLVLAVIFFGLFTPLALFFRLIGRDVLARRPRPDAATWWTDKPAAQGVRSYFRQS